MIISNDFVLLNLPKTGSTYVRKVLKKIYNKRVRKKLNPHGIYDQIPLKHKNKKIVSVVRNPYERLLSGFEFGFWQENPAIEQIEIDKHFPNFPDLDINEYIDYLILVSELSYVEKPENLKIGPMSLQFIYFFFKNPTEVISNLNEDYIKSESEFLKEIAPIEFLKQETLNQDLHDFLLDNKFSKNEA